MRSMDYRTYLTDELEVKTENPNPRSTQKPLSDERKLSYGTVAQHENLKHSGKTIAYEMPFCLERIETGGGGGEFDSSPCNDEP